MIQTRFRQHGPETEVVHLEGELDVSNAEPTRRMLLSRLHTEVRHLILNLEGLDFIDSTGLAAFVAVMLKAPTVGCRVSLVVPNPRMRRVLQIVGMRPQEHLWSCEQEVLGETVA